MKVRNRNFSCGVMSLLICPLSGQYDSIFYCLYLLSNYIFQFQFALLTKYFPIHFDFKLGYLF